MPYSYDDGANGLGGLGSAMQAGVNNYFKARQYSQDFDQKQQAMAIQRNLMQRQNLEADVKQDAQGNLMRGPNSEAAYGLQGKQIGYQGGLLNPQDSASQQSNELTQNLMRSSGVNAQIPQGMPAQAVQQNPYIKEAMGVQGMRARADAMTPYRQAGAEQAASKAYSHEMGPIENQIQSSNKILEILGKAKTGELVPSQVLSSELAGSLNGMFTGKPSTISGMNEAEYKSMEGNLAKFKAFVSGDPNAVITPGQLDQYEKEVKALQGEYLNQHQKRFSSFAKRQPPMVQGNLQDSYSDFRRSYAGHNAAPAAPANASQQGADAPPPGLSFEDFKKWKANRGSNR